MRRFLCGLILAFGGSTLLLGAQGQRLRAQLGYVASPTELLPGDVSLGAQSALGGRLSYEVLFTERFGLEMGLATSQHDYVLIIVNGVPRTSDFRLTPLTLAGNLHFGDTERVDPFFGAGLAYVTIGDFSARGNSVETPVDAELTWTAQFGMDIALKGNWGLGLGISYLNFRADAGAGKLGVETLSIFAGVVWSRK
jgi:outer membrane protein W